jgi:integrase/recombinase XerD
MRIELQQYLLSRFSVTALTQIATEELPKPLFATQMRAGFTGASSHSGRRSFLTKLSAKSVPLKTMMELAGHRQAQTTMRYVSVTPDMKRAAVELL